jgi:hypothetical protein
MRGPNRPYLHPFLFLVAADIVAIAYVLRCLFNATAKHIHP